MPFEMHEIIFFSKLKIIIEKICVPTLPKLSDLLPETHLFFYLADFQTFENRVDPDQLASSEAT